MKLKTYSIAIFAIVTAMLYAYYQLNPLTTIVRIGNVSYKTEVAVTNSEKERGLGGRNQLVEGHAMIFPYDHKEQYSFWMKDMRFPIDIIWIEDTAIVDIAHNVPIPDGASLPSYSPRTPVNKVLEIPAGDAKKYGFAPGDLVHIDN
jgi:uncharacterized protein